MLRRLARSPALLVLASLLLLACGQGAKGLPSAAGEYPIRSVSFDGKQYSFFWQGADGMLHEARGDDFKLVQNDERSYLQVGQGTPILHLKADEGIAVRGRDGGGAFSSMWFPFMLGYALGGSGPWVTVPQSGPPTSQPSYRYPPTDSFGRGDTLHGSEATTRPSPPDYSKIKPAPNAVSGQGGGTGAGTATSNRGQSADSGQSGGTGAGSAVTGRSQTADSGQGAGVGSGAAATNKSTGTDSGQSAGTGDGSAASSKGRSGSGLSAPSSGDNGGGTVTSRPGNGSGGARSSGGARVGGGRR